jgi:hypothetical protein
MRYLASLLLALVTGNTCLAQSEATKTLASLLAEGYEIKAMGSIGRPIFFVQKSTSAYVCEFPSALPSDKDLYGLVLATVTCSRIRAS